MIRYLTTLLLLFWGLLDYNWAFSNDKDHTAPLSELEEELKNIADEILNNDSLEYKLELNLTFQKRMFNILQREDSYNYKFSNLKTISRIYPEDNSFRIFTWYITDFTYKFCHYYGMVQRKITTKDGKNKIIVIPLIDKTDNLPAAEATVLTPQNWMGALYYVPKNKEFGVTTYQGLIYRYHPIKQKHIKEKYKFYVLLGWNGHDISTNYKIIDTINFEDKEDTSIVTFGLPIFYFSRVPKSRVVIEYSDNSSVTLNYAKVIRKGFLGFKKKQEMIVFDHIVMPQNTRPTVFWQAGSDGTYDALAFYNKFYENRKGFFGYHKNVDVYVPELEKYNPKIIKKQAEAERKRLQKAGIQLPQKK